MASMFSKDSLKDYLSEFISSDITDNVSVEFLRHHLKKNFYDGSGVSVFVAGESTFVSLEVSPQPIGLHGHYNISLLKISEYEDINTKVFRGKSTPGIILIDFAERKMQHLDITSKVGITIVISANEINKYLKPSALVHRMEVGYGFSEGRGSNYQDTHLNESYRKARAYSDRSMEVRLKEYGLSYWNTVNIGNMEGISLQRRWTDYTTDGVWFLPTSVIHQERQNTENELRGLGFPFKNKSFYMNFSFAY